MIIVCIFVAMKREEEAISVGVDSSGAQGDAGVRGLPGQVLDTAALLTEEQKVSCQHTSAGLTSSSSGHFWLSG